MDKPTPALTRPISYPEIEQIATLLADARRVVIMQADNPDADSLGSALALEQILGDMGKEPYLYCGVHIPDYLHYLPGWDRVSNELPIAFDLTIIVDTSADSLFGTLNATTERLLVGKKPCIVIDHHAVEPDIPYASVICNPTAVATGEVLYELAAQLDWPLNLAAQRNLLAAIMADSLGLTSEGTSARSIHIVGELVEGGVSIAALEHNRRELMRKSADLTAYKGELLQRIEYFAGGRISVVHIPWPEIERYSHAYNPPMLVMDDMRFTTGVDVAIAFKTYNDGKVTGKIRCNYGSAIAGDMAKHFGGGGHPYASGFKITDGRPYADIKKECIEVAGRLLDELAEK
ncbi:MAG TPA: DHH family phosphoesterase [Candidatus Saccharimonadales bacterium]|nr:DHH family phosphoesterase [Candidatus Saccharimonadales bacterium]